MTKYKIDYALLIGSLLLVIIFAEILEAVLHFDNSIMFVVQLLLSFPIIYYSSILPFKKNLQLALDVMKELEIEKRSLNALTCIDPLTGLGNRRMIETRFSEIASSASRYKKGICVIMLDIDKFKTINDMYGHPVGDEYLIKISNTIRECVRPYDTVCRYGGEEFAVITNDFSSIESSKELGERLRLGIQNINRPDGMPLTVSVGIMFTMDNFDLDWLISEADHAMYRAKGAGGNKVQYNGEFIT